MFRVGFDLLLLSAEFQTEPQPPDVIAFDAK